MCEFGKPNERKPCALTSDFRPATDDLQIRTELKRTLVSEYSNDPDTIIIEELGLRHGYCRVDLAVVNGSLHGYEIKSDRDTLRRLVRQIDTYNRVLDFVTLVTGERHAQKCAEIAPCWWGLLVATRSRSGGVKLSKLRAPSRNPAPENLATAKLLWREEALALLEELGAADRIRSKPRKLIYARLASVASRDELSACVRRHLKSRTGWRSDERQTSGGG